MRSPLVPFYWKSHQCHGLKFGGEVNCQNVFQLVLIDDPYSDKPSIRSSSTQKVYLRHRVDDESVFVWKPNSSHERLLSLENYLHDVKQISMVKTFLTRLQKKGHKTKILEKDTLLDFHYKLCEKFWIAHKLFIQKAPIYWGINTEIASQLASPKSFWPSDTENLSDEFIARSYQRIKVLLEITSKLLKLFDDDLKKIKDWLNTPHINFDNESALQLMLKKKSGIFVVQENIHLRI